MPGYAENRIGAFLKELGSSSQTPGGGSAAALVAGAGLALLEMTARINAKKGARASGRVIKNTVSRRLRAERLITDDADAFKEIARLMKTPARKTALQKALKKGAAVPFAICTLAYEGLLDAKNEMPRTGWWLAGDLAESAILLKAAFQAARLNVEINLKFISDKKLAARFQKNLSGLQKRVLTLKRAIVKIVA